MTNPQDLTGRELDLAVTRALGYVWWAGIGFGDGNSGVTYLRPNEHPPTGWKRIDAPGPEYGSPWLPGYDCDGDRIPEMFAEIAARCDATTLVEVTRNGPQKFEAATLGSFMHRHDRFATGSTPNEALARLLLMVAGR